MRALILVAGAALMVSACASEEAAENTMNVDDAMMTDNVVNDTMDANLGMNADVNADVNADINADVNADINATANNAM